MSAGKPRPVGRPPARVVGEIPWTDAVERALRKPRPNGGWPKPSPAPEPKKPPGKKKPKP